MKFFEKWFAKEEEPPATEIREETRDAEASYAVDVLHTLTNLMKDLHVLGDPDQIAMTALKMGCEFYQAEWCGILDCDTSVEVFTPYWWYTPVQDDQTHVLFQEFEYFEGFTRWVEALRNHTPIVVPDVEAIRKKYPVEYANYQRLECQAVMGAPYAGHSLGFVALKNATRYADRPEVLQMISTVVVQQVHERKLVDAAKVIVPAEQLENENDVLIKLFGGLEIYMTNNGSTTKNNQSEYQLLCIVKDKVVYFLDVTKHPPKGQDYFDFHILEMIEENGWMDEIGFLEVKDAIPGSMKPIIREAKDFFMLYAEGSFNVGVEMGGKLYYPCFGVSMARTPINMTLAVNELYKRIDELPDDTEFDIRVTEKQMPELFIK